MLAPEQAGRGKGASEEEWMDRLDAAIGNSVKAHMIDFPVEHQHLVPGFVHHGLDAAARVDDGKPPEAESSAI